MYSLDYLAHERDMFILALEEKLYLEELEELRKGGDEDGLQQEQDDYDESAC